MLQIFILAAVALFLFWRLRAVLGSREGFEKTLRQIKNDTIVNEQEVSVDQTTKNSVDNDILDYVEEDSKSAEAFKKIKDFDKDFSVNKFVSGAKMAYEVILMAFENGDVEKLENLLDKKVLRSFKSVINKRLKEGLTVDAKFIGMRDIAGDDAREGTMNSFRKKLRDGLLDHTEIEIEVFEKNNPLSMLDLPGSTNASMGVMNLNDIFGKNFGSLKKKKKIKVGESHKILIDQEMDKLLDDEIIQKEAKKRVEQSGIVFIDEIDKVCTSSTSKSAEISREGVQRDLLPLIEGTTVSTKYGPVKTDQILFICSGAFHLSKPSDLLPELQGRLPIRVQLSPLKKEHFKQILTDTDNSLAKQYIALMKTEGVELVFDDEGVEKICLLAEEVNLNVENIGARRLHTILEKVLENISFNAPDLTGKKVVVDAKLVEKHVGSLSKTTDVRKYVL